MATFQYATTQGNVRSTPTQYTVQPNTTSISNTFKSLENAITGGMQLKKTQNDMEFKENKLELQNKINTFQTAWDGSTYEQQQQMAGTMSGLFVDPYAGDSIYDQQLRSYGLNALTQFQSNLNKTGVEVEHNSILTSQQVGFIDSGNKFNDTQELDGKRVVVDSYYEQFVKPYEGIKTPKAQELYSKGLEHFTKLESAYKKVSDDRANNAISSKVFESVQAELQVNGFVNPKRYSEIKGELERRTDWADKSTALTETLDQAILLGMRAMFTQSDVPKTKENADLYMTRLEEFAKASPKIVGKAYYNDAVIFGNSLRTAVDRTDQSAYAAMLQDDTVSLAEYKTRSQEMLSRNLITEEELSNNVFQKNQKLVSSKVKPQIATMVQNMDFDGLTEMAKNGHGGTISTIVSDTLNLTFSNLSESRSPIEAAAQTLGVFKNFKDNGFDIGAIEGVDSILKSHAENRIQTADDVTNFVATYELASQSGYRKGITSAMSADYTVLKAFAQMGVPDIANKFNNYKLNPQPVKNADIDESLLGLFNNVGRTYTGWDDDLGSRNITQLSNVFRPIVRAGLKAGIDPEDMLEDWTAILEQHYIRPDPGFFTSEVLVPVTPDVNTEKQYKDAFDAVDNFYDGDISYFAPQQFDKPMGQWLAWDNNGNYYTISYERVKTAAQTGVLPPEEN